MIELIIAQRRRDLGSFEVGRVLPFAQRRMVGPYIFFDRMGPKQIAPGLPREADVRPHPHIGLSTITYLFDGEIMHRDSLGSEQAVRPGEVNWMTAGRGITHSERFEKLRAQGGPLDGIQAWVALPDGREEMDPGFWHYANHDLPAFDDDGSLRRARAFGREQQAIVQQALRPHHSASMLRATKRAMLSTLSKFSGSMSLSLTLMPNCSSRNMTISSTPVESMMPRSSSDALSSSCDASVVKRRLSRMYARTLSRIVAMSCCMLDVPSDDLILCAQAAAGDASRRLTNVSSSSIVDTIPTKA